MATAIEYRPLASLIVNPRNPKAHDTQAVAASVSRFGFIEPIVIDERTGFIISGHGRRRSLLDSQINGDPIPEGVTLADDGDWLIPVVTGYSSRDDNEATGALIALNRTNELGGWVDDELLNLLETLSQVDDGLEGVGYTDGDITALGDLLENFASFGQSTQKDTGEVDISKFIDFDDAQYSSGEDGRETNTLDGGSGDASGDATGSDEEGGPISIADLHYECPECGYKW